MNVNLFRNRVFVDTNNQVKMMSLAWALTQQNQCPYKKRKLWGLAHARKPGEERDTQREDFCVKMEAKTGVMLHKPRNMCGYQSWER